HLYYIYAHFTFSFSYNSSYLLYLFRYFFFLLIPHPPRSTLFPYTTLFRSLSARSSVSGLPPAWARSLRDAGPKNHSWLFRPKNRSEEHTSELQSRGHLVCRLLLEKKKIIKRTEKIVDNYYLCISKADENRI